MLFNSFLFLLAFLPFALVLHWAVEKHAPAQRLPLLLVLSLAFYGYWDWRFVPLIVISIGVNWLIARQFIASKRGALIIGAIAANLAVLALFKYAGFFTASLNALAQLGLPKPEIVLPLGISFFTFHHIMYLVDLKSGVAPPLDLTRYALYIAFFPQVLAGPLVRWSEIVHQLEEKPFRQGWEERCARGIMLLVIGLAKKVLIGDPLADYANPVFAAAAEGKVISFIEGWQAALAFTFQIYFDFSGYTDMALGIALFFGITLPQNFDVPYRAASLQDFWRRWHMTLSRFLRDYLYIPLGGSRNGTGIQVFALFGTMALGGLWHGAGWTFVAWGIAHGIGMGAGVLWQRAALPMPLVLGWLLTFVFVVITWVLFRAQTFDAAVAIYQGMLGFSGMGSGFRWRALALGAAVAVIGPSSWIAAQRIQPSRRSAFFFALLMVIALLKIGDDANYDFIYFQF